MSLYPPHERQVKPMCNKNTTMSGVYDRIRRLRIALGLSQEELAKTVGYTDKSMMSKIELGKVDLPLTKIGLIAAALGTTPKDLLFPAKDATPRR